LDLWFGNGGDENCWSCVIATIAELDAVGFIRAALHADTRTPARRRTP